MTSLKLSRIILVCVFTFISLLAGYVLYQYYDHLCKAKRLHFFEHNEALLDKLTERTQVTWENTLLTLKTDAQRFISGSDQDFSKALRVIVASKTSIRQAVYINAETIYLPEWKKQRHPDTSRPLIPDLLDNPLFKRAEIFEYQYKDYPEAIKLYERFWLENPDNLKAANALARCLYKNQSLIRSEKLYRQIFVQNPASESQYETPLAVISAFQLLNIYQAQANTRTALAFGQQLYNELLDEKWNFPQPKTDFFKQKTLISLQPFFPTDQPPRAFRQILQREKQLNRIKRYVQFISARIIPFIEGSVIDHYKIYFFSQKKASHFLFIIPHGKSTIVLDIDYAAFVKENVVTPLNDLAKDYGVGMRLLCHHGIENILTIPQGTKTTFSISDHFRDLHLEITLPDLPQLRLEAYLAKLKLYFGAGYALFIIVLLLIYLVLNKQIQFADLKSDFVSHVSHELKTPLTSLRMFSELLQKNPNLSSKKRNQYYNIMNQESVRLSRLIENLLDISRIERKKNQYAFQPVALDDVIRAAIEIFHYASVEFSQHLDIKLTCKNQLLPLDKDAVIQLILNILDNAKKFSPEKSTIWVRSRCQEGSAVIEIEDQGPGMTKKEIQKVFKMFYQVKKSYEAKFKGVGLGLAIVKNIAQAHHAEVQIESAPGKGTTIRVFFPLSTESTMNKAKKQSRKMNLEG